ncbi:hypothetical protein Tco_0163428 [Tanacetum coccineum]
MGTKENLSSFLLYWKFIIEGLFDDEYWTKAIGSTPIETSTGRSRVHGNLDGGGETVQVYWDLLGEFLDVKVARGGYGDVLCVAVCGNAMLWMTKRCIMHKESTHVKGNGGNLDTATGKSLQ